jgi:tripartite ATP-independent transporter DctM subunit
MALFLAGIVPGLMIGVALMAMNSWLSWRHGFARGPARMPLGRFLREQGTVFAALPLPFIIVGGIHGGVFTPTEAAAVAAVYAFGVARFVLRSLSWGILPRLLLRTALMTSAVLMIVATASVFAWLLTVLRIPQVMTGWILSLGLSDIMLLLAIALFLLICGLFIDTLPGVLLFVPIIAPIADSVGLNPVQTALVVILSLTMGMITPPVGGVLFVVTAVSGVPLARVIGAIWPFFFAIFAVLLLLIVVPGVSAWLPGQFGYHFD